MMTREQKKGFSLIELSVVMTIMAILSVLGIAALFLVRKVSLVDQVSDEILSQLRETQNEAISVVNAPILPDNTSPIPAVWGFKVHGGDPCNPCTVETFYLKTNGANIEQVALKKFTYNQLSSLTITAPDNSITSLTDYYAMYSTPFGKYYGARENNANLWTENLIIPHDYILSSTGGFSVSGKVKITATSEDYSRTITVTARGESYAE